MLALALATLMIIAGLVIDGGAAYGQRRQMQNAADAAAMAGAAAVDDVRFSGAVPATIQDKVDQIAAENDAETWVCQIVDVDGTVLGSCSDSGAIANVAAQGVRVEPTDVRTTTFGQLVGMSTISAVADATATIQPIVGGKAPFAVCSGGASGSYDLLGPDGKIDPAKALLRGKIAIMAAQVYMNDPSCAAVGGVGGGAGSFKGEIDQEIVLVGDEVVASSNPGNSLPPFETVACPAPLTTTDCLLLPMVGETVGTGGNAQMTVVDWGYWQVTEDDTGAVDPPNGSVKLWGTFVAVAGPGSVPGGVPGSGPVTGNQVRTVSLIE
jgi:Flp pilus assembly protein TadG